MIRAHADEAERERQLPDAVAEAMRERGLHRLFHPKAYGGLEVDPMTAFRVFEEAARIDSATDGISSYRAERMRSERISPIEAPKKYSPRRMRSWRARFFRLERQSPWTAGIAGQCSFQSGSRHATAFIGLANIYDGDVPRLGPNGAPIGLITACPASEAAIIDCS
jgi:hypothetical protein